MYFLSQPETKCPATESMENLLVAMTTTKTSGTSAPIKVVRNNALRPYDKYFHIFHQWCYFLYKIWVGLKCILSQVAPNCVDLWK